MSHLGDRIISQLQESLPGRSHGTNNPSGCAISADRRFRYRRFERQGIISKAEQSTSPTEPALACFSSILKQGVHNVDVHVRTVAKRFFLSHLPSTFSLRYWYFARAWFKADELPGTRLHALNIRQTLHWSSSVSACLSLQSAHAFWWKMTLATTPWSADFRCCNWSELVSYWVRYLS